LKRKPRAEAHCAQQRNGEQHGNDLSYHFHD